MNDAECMRSRQGGANLRRDVQDSVDRQCPSSPYDAAQILAVHVLHDNKQPAILGPVQVFDSNRMRMPQLAGNDRLGAQPLDEAFVLEVLIVDQLNGEDFVE